MKNAFKYIAASFAILSGFSVSAQNLETGTYEIQNGVAYAKRAKVNNDGTYTIDLETFVAGEVTETYEAVPVDVVLVLDVSGSMRDEISSAKYVAASVSSLTYNENAGLTDYYYLYNNQYCPVTVGSATSGGWWSSTTYYFLSFTTSNGNTRYILANGQSTSNRPSNVTDPSTNLLGSNTTLYSKESDPVTKMDALKSAVKAFILEIEKNDLYEDDGVTARSTPLNNRISIVKFAGNTYYRNGNTTNTANLDEGNDTYGSYNYNATQVVKGFRSTSTAANVTELTGAIDALTAAGATSADLGMNLASMLITQASNDASRSDSKKTVVFFTDGEPNHQSGFDTGVATDAIKNSKTIKDITYGTGDDATHPSVFSVGLFASKPTSGSNLENFMNYISSNYPGATAYNNGGTKDSNDYYMDASGGSADDLKAIFTAIAHHAGGSGNTQVSGGSTLTVDVVSSSFSVPTTFQNASDVVTVLVAPCNGKTTIGGKEYFTFGAEKAPTEYGLPAITPSISVADNKVTTTGFDYSGNWCGPDPTSTSAIHNYAYHGYKQIIRFVITVNDDAVGGPAVNTNDENSGIYLEGATEPLIKFNRPVVKLPVQIWLQKQGLRPGDSAVFTLYMCPFTSYDVNKTPEENTWTNFTKVVVNYEDMDENGMVKIVGLDPDFFYRLKEDAWAFGYTYQNNGLQYTVGDNVENPFVFVNEPKPVKYDEAVARNVFNEKTASSGGDEGGSSE